MRSARLAWLAALGAAVAGIQLQASAVLLRLPQTPDVSFAVSLARTTYSISEQIPVSYRIVNVSKRRLYVPRGFEATACLGFGPPRIWGWFENSAGQQFRHGYGVSCSSTSGELPTLTERIRRGTVPLIPGEWRDGVLSMDPTRLPAGPYRIEAVLRGWNVNDFSPAEADELARMGIALLSGDVPASVTVTITP
jgi:hypothetical protein